MALALFEGMTEPTSPRRFAHFGAILLTALGLIPGGARLLEMPPRLLYDAQMYMDVTLTLYPLYGSVAAIIQIFAIVAAALLTFLTRKRRIFPVALTGTLCLIVSVAIWFFVVGPVNALWMEAAAAAPGTAPELFLELRSRWEYGHLAAFLAWFVGYCLILYSAFLYRPHP
ncbi:MAG: hypothetical protein WD448_11415 [Woeseia sp.]